VVDWLPLAAVIVVVLGQPGRPRGRASQVAVAAWIAGLVLGGLEALLLAPLLHALLVGLATAAALRFAAPRLAAAGELS
jgi:hypothetical protein